MTTTSATRHTTKHLENDDQQTAALAYAERLAALHADLATQVDGLVTSQGWQDMLTAASRFTTYSLNNQLFLILQLSRRAMPAGSRVAGFNTWRSLGRNVRKGEKGLAVIAPCTYTAKAAGEGSVSEPETPQGRDRVKPAKTLRGFKIAYVFAQSQTDGEDVPGIRPTLLAGEAPVGLWDGLSALLATEGYRVERGDCSGANGYTDPRARLVRVRTDVDDAQAAKTLAYELGHVILGHAQPEYDYVACRDGAEIEAESVAYVVCSAAGMDTSAYTTAYIAGWASGDLRKVKASAERVVTTAAAILSRLDAEVSRAAGGAVAA